MTAKSVKASVASEFHASHALLDVVPKGDSVGVFHGNTLVAVTTISVRGGVAKVVAHTASLYNSGDALMKSCRHVESRNPRISEWRAHSDSMVSDGREFIAAGFTYVQNTELSYKLFHRKELRDAKEYPKSRFKSDPSLKFHDGLTVKQLCELNNISRVYDAGGRLFTRGKFGG